MFKENGFAINAAKGKNRKKEDSAVLVKSPS
jgi:hypothetical protein